MKRLQLRVETGDRSGTLFEVGPGGLGLGRASSNGLQLPDEELSRNHCLFESSGEAGLRVTDLASANGTIVNGTAIGESPVELKAGDVIEAGTTRLTVVGEASEPAAEKPESEPEPAAESESGEKPAPEAPKAAQPKKPLPPLKSLEPERGSLLGKLLWGVALAAAGWALWSHRAAILPYVGRYFGQDAAVASSPVKSFSYERVIANTGTVYRAALELGEDGVLRVQVDDVPAAGRHEKDTDRLEAAEREALLALFADPQLAACAGDHGAAERDPQELDSRTLKVVEASRTWRIRVVNAPVPEAFGRFCEKLEKLSGMGSR